MNIYNISNVEIQSVVKAENKATGSQYIQYGRFLKFFQLIYVVKGEAEIVFNDTVFINKPGTIVLLPEGACSNYQARIISDEDCIAVFFHGDFPVHPQLFTKSFLKNTKLPSLKEDKINRAVAFIHEHYADSSFPYHQLHALCGISYTYFKKLFIARFSVTPSSYVRHLKIQRACELLSTNEFNVTQVALACGFSDVAYFSKVFKNETGVAPSKWGK